MRYNLKKVLVFILSAAMLFALLPSVTLMAIPVYTPTVGSVVRFDGEDWLCLSVSPTDGYKLLRSGKYGSTRFTYDGISYTDSNNSLRAYLNGTFYNEFSDEQKEQIRLATWNCGYIDNEGSWTVNDYIGALTYSEFYDIQDEDWYVQQTH
ncbi:MAG: hypothetical protein VB120_01210 [Lachnospiraceae bacterium]|nr:hypothetical protein [Lachnospiraceae bacterium]